ncbi:MAG: hypothetical protein KAJ29_02720, partial [Alphaproteobacteria bacterium]|nr:hypothetical protein [Alphaproteobacteria bacterium]
MVQRRQDMVREARKLSAKTHKEANAESAVQQKEQPENVAGDPAEEVRGVQESELFSGADADKLSLYAELLNVQEKMPKTVDADSAFFKEIEWKCERLQGEYDKVSEQVKEHSPQEALTILSDGLENAFTQMLAYNDMRKAGGQSPFAVDQFISGAIDPDVRKEISDHSASLSDEEKTQYSGIAKVMVADFTSDPNAKNQTELSVVARIAGGEKIDTAGAKTFAQAKTAVSEHVGVMRTQQIKTLVDQKLANGLTPKDIVALSSKALGIEMSTVGAIPKDDVTVFEQINNGLELLSHNLDAEAAKDNGIVGRLQKADPAQYPEDLKALIGERTEGKEGDDLVQAKDAAINEYAITIAGAAVGQQLLIQSMALRLAYNNSLEPQNKELVTVAGTDKDVRADMVNHFQSLSETEQTQYLALSQEVLSNLNGSLQVADAYVTSIGDLDMSGTQNIDQAKTLVTDYQAQQYQDAVDDSVETVKYFGGAYGLKAGPIEDVLRQAFSLYVNKSATFLKQIDKEGVSIEGVGELAKRDVFIAESMKNPEILEALENGTFTKEQIESSVQQNYEQLSGQLAMAMMQKELTCMLAYNQGVATKSEHITTVEGADAKVEQGRKYLEHIKGENPDLHTKIVERAGDIIGNFGNAANFLAAELKKGKTLQVTSPSSEVAESAPDDKVEETVTQYKTVMVPDIPEGMQERFRRLEQALGMLAPDLNDRKEYKGFDIAPEKELQGPGEVDGVFDEKAYASYKGVMGHLNFLTGLSENKPLLINAKLDEAARGLNPLFGDNESAQLAELMDKDDPQKFLSEEKEVKALEKMLIGQVDDKLEALGADTRRGKIKYAKGKIKDAKEVEYANEIDELKASKKLISQVIKDLKVLDKAGLLNGPIEMVATQVPVEVSKIQVAKNAAGNDASGATESAISTVIGGTKDVPKDVPKDV